MSKIYSQSLAKTLFLLPILVLFLFIYTHTRCKATLELKKNNASSWLKLFSCFRDLQVEKLAKGLQFSLTKLTF